MSVKQEQISFATKIIVQVIIAVCGASIMMMVYDIKEELKVLRDHEKRIYKLEVKTGIADGNKRHIQGFRQSGR